jgi:DNA helicase-2/ATP-dependent DNA helicase PcrA
MAEATESRSLASLGMTTSEAAPPVPSESQRRAIEAGIGPVLVLAGPGAGKTYCLAQRIRFLIEQRGADPARICAFTFTNKAAGEIAARLATHIGERASHVKGGTIHAFCAELLRMHGDKVGVRPGFGIADEDYQRAALRRLGVPARWQGGVLNRFAAARFRGEVLTDKDEEWFTRYERFLDKRNMVDYDTLVVKAAELMTEFPEIADSVRAKWDHVLVDEFQDLNRKQYQVIKSLASGHRSLFGVGDDEQSIYSWTGADPSVFKAFANDFEIVGDDRQVSLRENRRCPREYFALARRLVDYNPALFTSRLHATPEKSTPFPAAVYAFDTEKEEMTWIVEDIRRDRDENGLKWGNVALLYRTNRIGDQAESAFLNAGIPVRLARGRALSEDPVVAYVIAALRVIARPDDLVHKENFLGTVLPRTLVDSARASAEENGERVVDRLDKMGKALPHEDSDGRKIRRGFSALRNLAALGSRFTALEPLVNELLSQRVGEYRSSLDELHHDLADPASNAEVVALADRLRVAGRGSRVRIARLGGVEIAMKAVLLAVGFREIDLGGPAPGAGVVNITGTETPTLGAMLGLFKAAQIIASEGFTNAFADFTAVDIETTGRDTMTAQVIEIAAVRVRAGKVVDEYVTLVKPRVAIEPGATATHGISEAEVADAPHFEEIWARLRDFCGKDVLVAHNGNQFDFPIIRRMASELGLEGADAFTTYDTLPLARELFEGSAKLEDLAKGLQVDAGQSHRALDDTRTLAHVFLGMNARKIEKARKTALAGSLDFLGLGLALSNPKLLVEEAKLLCDRLRVYPLGPYSESLEFYHRERERGDDLSLMTRDELIDLLGGGELRERLKTQRDAMQRYPVAMSRMRGLLATCSEGTLAEQIETFLEKATLSSRPTETEPAKERVNLLTLHATKGLEFSRVYIVGVEDSQFLSSNPNRPPARTEIEESRRLLYVGMTRAEDRLVMTRVVRREGEPTGGHQFFDEMGLKPVPQ